MNLKIIGKCDVCGQRNFIEYIHARDRFSGWEYSFSQCLNCTHIFLNPRPRVSDLLQHYPEHYECYSSPEPVSRIEKWHQDQEAEKRIRLVEAASPISGNLLDVGAGNASFVKAAHTCGWEVTGIEPNWEMMDHGPRSEDFKIITKEFTNFEPGRQLYDVITFWDVLEHLPSPMEALEKAVGLLTDQGVIIFSIPNIDSFDRNLFRSAWIGWDPPRHLHLFTEDSLEYLTNRLALEISQKRCFSGGKGAFLLSLENVRSRITGGKRLNKLYSLISALLLPYRRISYHLNRGPIITFVIRKSK